MWLHRLLGFIDKHRYLALGLTFLLTFVPVVGVVTILLAALMTLTKSVLEGAAFTIAATLPLLAGVYFHAENAMPIALWVGIGIAVSSNVLTWVFAVMLRQRMSWSAILQLAALFGVLVISVLHLVYPEMAAWWGDQLQSIYQQVETADTGSKNVYAEAINVTKSIATGMAVAFVLFNAFAQLMVARWLQSLLYNQHLLRRELHGVRLSSLAGMLFLLSMVFWYLGNAVVLDIMPVLYLLFCVAGLSVIHYLFGLFDSPMTWFWMTLLYITLILTIPASIMIVTLIALLDIWFNLRQRLKKVN